MTSRDLKMVYLRDTGKKMYNPEWVDSTERLLEYIDWLEEKVINLTEQIKILLKVTQNMTDALSILKKPDEEIIGTIDSPYAP